MHLHLRILIQLLTIIIVLIGFFWAVPILRAVEKPPKYGKCYFRTAKRLKDFEVANPQLKIIPDLMNAEAKPEPGKSFFFIETSSGNTKTKISDDAIEIANLSLRHACAVESVARLHPDADVFVLYTRPVYLPKYEYIPTPAAIEALLNYSNLYFNYLNIWKCTKGAFTEDWFLQGEIFKSKQPHENLLAYLRFLILWQYGGTVVDFNTIALDNFDGLSDNFLGTLSHNVVSTAIMKSSFDGLGHAFIELCLKEFTQLNFRDSHTSPANLSGIITKVLKEICQESDLPEIYNLSRCRFMNLLPPHAFHPIKPKETKTLFSQIYAKRTLKKLRHAYSLYLGDHMTTLYKSYINKTDALGIIAKKFCPLVYSMAKDYF